MWKGRVIQMETEQKQKAYTWARELCRLGGEDAEFLAKFWEELNNNPDIYEEFIYYMEHQDFLCRATVRGMTVVDIMVWQIDHFKAYMDRGMNDMRENKDRMLLMAFSTMLKMKRDPQAYVRQFSEETGTDYPDKFR
jgi:hypothetical protein